MQAHVDQKHVAGLATLIARKGKLAHFACYGKRNLESGAALTEDTIFRIYSISKPLTCVAALLLYEEKRFGLDDPVGKFLPTLGEMKVYAESGPWRAQERPMTIRDLLRHTSGLTYGYSASHPVDALYQKANILNRKGTLKEMIKKLAKLPLRYQPGSQWYYSLATDVLGHLVEVLSGQSLGEFCTRRICAPLRMPDTGFELPAEKFDRLAAIYSRTEAGALVPWGGSIETTIYQKPVSFHSGGGGAFSTLPDYLRFCQMLLNGGALGKTRLLKRETVAEMTKNQLPAPFRPGMGFGFGVQVCVDVAATKQPGSVGTFGWAGGGNTYFFVDPKQELIAMVWSQLSGTTTLSQEMREAVYEALL